MTAWWPEGDLLLTSVDPLRKISPNAVAMDLLVIQSQLFSLRPSEEPLHPRNIAPVFLRR